MQVGDALGRLVFEFRQEAGRVFDRAAGFGFDQGRRERPDELFPPRPQALVQLRGVSASVSIRSNCSAYRCSTTFSHRGLWDRSKVGLGV